MTEKTAAVPATAKTPLQRSSKLAKPGASPLPLHDVTRLKGDADKSPPAPSAESLAASKSVAPAANPEHAKDPLWYKDAIIYQLHIKAFFDSNNDGIGDFGGLIAKLDYLQNLGVNTLWILPFYPSPLRDDGYDIAEYRDVNPSYGTMADFRSFVKEAHARGLRVITELVINHTSDQHPWFQRARRAPAGSPERNFYVWSDTDKKYAGTRIIFSDTEKSNWTWDPEANAYFWHRFFSHQPDLNFDNPEVLKEVIDIMYFWLDMGVDGLRLDAIPYLCEREGTNNENLPETHAILKKIRAALDSKYPDRMLLAEANQWPEDVMDYFGNGDECHMSFHFPLMPRMYMAVAQEDRHPITDIMYQTPEIPEKCQWAIFLRNHDELTLEMVTDRERDYLWNFYASDKRARINFGIRRRLAPLMDNDRRKIELLNGMLMSMPGTPVMYYGDEIGMGDNIFLGDRDGVRTPMQWSPDRNGGFSVADPARLYLPAIMDPIYGYQGINVEAQRRVQNSLYNWMRNLIGVVKETKVFGRGSLRFLKPSNRKVLAYLREYGDEKILCVANLSRSPQPVELDLREFKDSVPVEMLSQSEFPPIGELPYFLTLSPYAFFWFRLTEKNAGESLEDTPELLTLVLPQKGDDLFQGRARDTMEKQLLPGFLMKQRWYKGKNAGMPTIEMLHSYEVGEDFRIMLIVATPPGAGRQYYVMGSGIAWESAEQDPLEKLRSNALCKVRKVNRVGVLYESSHDENFVPALLTGFADQRALTSLDTRLDFYNVGAFPDMKSLPVKPLGGEQTNSSVIIGDKIIIKIIRQPQPGINPEEEIERFLTEISSFERTPKLLGGMRITGLGEQPLSIGLVQEVVRNQGDGWRVTLDYLERFISEADLANRGADELESDRHGMYAALAEQLGRRTAELHKALDFTSGDPAFDPEIVDARERENWIESAIAMAEDALRNLAQALPQLQGASKEAAAALLKKRDGLRRILQETLPGVIRTPRTRVHGDYHLGQVLVSDGDFYIIDFEGEPTRSLEERRRKTSPFKDVAGMIRSFDYAAASALKHAKLASEHEVEALAALLVDWRRQATEAFLRGYHESAIHHDDATAQNALTRFFILEKAFYEIVYESQHRPDWVDIPVRGVLALLEDEDRT